MQKLSTQNTLEYLKKTYQLETSLYGQKLLLNNIEDQIEEYQSWVPQEHVDRYFQYPNKELVSLVLLLAGVLFGGLCGYFINFNRFFRLSRLVRGFLGMAVGIIIAMGVRFAVTLFVVNKWNQEINWQNYQTKRIIDQKVSLLQNIAIS